MLSDVTASRDSLVTRRAGYKDSYLRLPFLFPPHRWCRKELLIKGNVPYKPDNEYPPTKKAVALFSRKRGKCVLRYFFFQI